MSISPPAVHSECEGTSHLEIINLEFSPFFMRPGMPIAQVIGEEVKGIPFGRAD